MLLDADERDRAPVVPIEDGIEALIPEARRRARRRRIRWVAAVSLLAGLGAAAYAAVGSRSGGVTGESAPHPFVNVRAFKGRGELAFISREKLWVLDGGAGRLRRLPVPDGYAPSSPVFSHDGRWLAYVASRSQDSYGPSELWIAHANGTGAHVVSRLVVNLFVGWSPSTDLVAVAAGESRYVPFGSPTALEVVSPGGLIRTLLTRSAQRTMMTRGAIWSAVWAPDGASLAVSTYSPELGAGTQILDVPVAAGVRRALWLSIRNPQRLTGALSCGRGCSANYAIAQLAGWWRKWGIAFWVFSSGMTHNSDATPLAVIARPGGAPRVIAQTLSDGTTDAVDAGLRGELAVVSTTTSAGREYAVGKTVKRCSPRTLGCAAVPGASTWTGRQLSCRPCFGAPATGPGSAVSLDPAWSPDGTLLAYAKAPAYRAAAVPTLRWYRAHQLYVWNARTGTTHRVGSISGSSVPTWSGDGDSLLYVSADGLWLADAATGNTVEIEHPLYSEATWTAAAASSLSYYGQIPWSRQFSWHTP